MSPLRLPLRLRRGRKREVEEAKDREGTSPDALETVAEVKGQKAKDGSLLDTSIPANDVGDQEEAARFLPPNARTVLLQSSPNWAEWLGLIRVSPEPSCCRRVK